MTALKSDLESAGKNNELNYIQEQSNKRISEKIQKTGKSVILQKYDLGCSILLMKIIYKN